MENDIVFANKCVWLLCIHVKLNGLPFDFADRPIAIVYAAAFIVYKYARQSKMYLYGVVTHRKTHFTASLEI